MEYRNKKVNIGGLHEERFSQAGVPQLHRILCLSDLALGDRLLSTCEPKTVLKAPHERLFLLVSGTHAQKYQKFLHYCPY